ncbi:MAG: alkaline phosphatase [Ignavibacteriales bacterium]|nr:alkaline phosphatase [Ignavibacteriales bacterium]
MLCSNKFFRLVFLFLILFPSNRIFSENGKKPKNIIIMIGDGMGLNYITASILNDDKNPFKEFNSIGLSITCSADNLITDSAAGATALASGYKTNNKYIGVDSAKIPLLNIFEFAKKHKLSTGVVVTSSITNATPACFVAHIDNRAREFEIAKQYVESGIDIAIGGGLKFFLTQSKGGGRSDGLDLVDSLKTKGYLFYKDSDELKTYNGTKKLFALLDDDGLKPVGQRNISLSELTTSSLKHLEQNKNGFVLMIEGSQIDWAAHANNQKQIMLELTEFERTIESVLTFAKKDGNTLVVITSDHETGGASIVSGKNDGSDIKFGFLTFGHTANCVGIFAYGPGEENFRGIMNINQIGKNFFKLINPTRNSKPIVSRTTTK